MAYQPVPSPTPPAAGPGGVGPGVPDPGVRPTTSPTAGAGTPQTQPKTGGVVGEVAGALGNLNPFSDLSDGVTAVRAWISNRHNWVRVSWTVGGACMFTIGVIMLAGRPATKAAATVVQVATPVGKAATAVRKATT